MRTKTSKAWMRSHVTDLYVRRARAQGYRSRAAFKLLEMDRRDKLLRPGMTVVDLGAAPGGWSQVAAENVGAGGRVIAVDLLPMAPVPGVEFIAGDFTQAEVAAKVKAALRGRLADLVICDMAPNISGVAAADQARSVYLAECARDFAFDVLQPRGALLVKVFQGSGFPELMRSLKGCFRKVLSRKPQASRSGSSELYLLCSEPLQAGDNGDAKV
jgi:23S rRNA (uridine2552-2'-O)-methyltransferase